MTQIIFLMWLADVAAWMRGLGVGALVVLILMLVVGSIGSIGKGDTGPLQMVWRVGRWLLIPIVLAGLLPTATTLRLAAASSAVVVAADTATGQKAVAAIDAILERIAREATK